MAGHRGTLRPDWRKIHLLIIPPAKGVLADRRTAGSTLRDRSRRDGDEIKDVAAIERQFVRFALFDHLAKGRRFGLQERRLRRHFDDLADLADLKDRGNVSALLHLNGDVSSGEVLKPLFFDIDAVLTGEKVHECEQSIRATLLSALFGSAHIGQRDRGVGDCGAGRVSNGTYDGAIGALGL